MYLKTNFCRCVVTLTFILSSEILFARFIETDADRIDQEERYNTETYNDKYSYRYPVDWEQLYEKSDAAVRLNAGSLNATRFDYYEDVKLYAANETAGFQYIQRRSEDVLEQVTYREVRASGFFDGGLYVSMVADGGSFKEYGDVGWALGLGDVRRPLFEILYWSVDHFYDTKKSDLMDSRSEQAWTLALKSNLPIGDKAQISLTGEYDQPITWFRPSQGYIYEYAQQNFGLKAVYHLSSMQTMTLELSSARKRESKNWDQLRYEKKLDRQVNISELRWSKKDALFTDEVGTAYVDRRASYKHEIDLKNSSQELPEAQSPDHSKRDEIVLWATRYSPWIADRHFMQYGVFINRVNLKETRHQVATESKIQWAWEYRYHTNARVVLNTTWDTDQLADDFPYNKETFKPWGGGDIQFIAAF